MLEIEHGLLAAQVWLADVGRFPEEAGLMVRLDYTLPLPVVIERLSDLWAGAHGPAPRRGRVRGGRHRELLRALDGRQNGKSVREIAEDLFSRQRVAAD